MKWRLLIWVPVALTMAFPTLSAAQDIQHEPGRIIVKFCTAVGKVKAQERDGLVSVGIPSLDQRMKQYGVNSIGQLFPHKSSQLGLIYQFEFDPRYDARVVADDFAGDDHLLYAEPRYIHRPCEAPNDFFYMDGTQWYLDQVHGPQAWDITHGDSLVVIGVVDTGVDWDHPDLFGNIWVNPGEDLNGDGRITAVDINGVDDDGNGYVDDFYGWDFGGGGGYPDNNPMESPGPFGSHGTHCAGTAAAVTDNELGVAGMAWNCSIVVVKVSRDGEDFIRHGYEGIQYAADNGADVISISWGRAGGSPAQWEQEIIDSAFARGAIVVAAAGNDPGTAPPDTCPLYYPAWYNHVTAVAATDINDQVPGWSFYGSWVDVSAPGVGIYSTFWNDTYHMRSGTSMACPLVAGVAALIKSLEPEMNSDQFEARMRMTSDDIDGLNPGYEGWLGGGRLNAYRALYENVPVVLAGFRATAGQDGIVLDWVTAAEIDCHRWEIYRAEGEDGQFVRIGQLPGQGSTETVNVYRWVDGQVSPGMFYYYKLKQVDFDGGTWWSHPVSATATVPLTYALHQNYPNPFNASTEIRYQIPRNGHVALRVFNTLGQEVQTLVDVQQKAGEYGVVWDGRDSSGHEVASGLYFCRLRVGEFGKTVKMVLMR
jgi:subtilisin family serine protease